MRAARESGRTREALRAVALFEALKGAVVLLAGTGLLALLHRDVHALAASLVAHTHLNPASRYPAVFLDLANRLTDPHLQRLALGAFAYALLRFVEAYGLLRQRAWAEALAAFSGAVYVPFELQELARRPSWLAAALLLLNLLVVGLMLRALALRRRPLQRPAD
jgi:uncharacterized membrane protein (DUF2068 family)